MRPPPSRSDPHWFDGRARAAGGALARHRAARSRALASPPSPSAPRGCWRRGALLMRGAAASGLIGASAQAIAVPPSFIRRRPRQQGLLLQTSRAPPGPLSRPGAPTPPLYLSCRQARRRALRSGAPGARSVRTVATTTSAPRRALPTGEPRPPCRAPPRRRNTKGPKGIPGRRPNQPSRLQGGRAAPLLGHMLTLPRAPSGAAARVWAAGRTTRALTITERSCCFLPARARTPGRALARLARCWARRERRLGAGAIPPAAPASRHARRAPGK